MSVDSSMAYDFVAPRQIVFGWGRRRELPELAKALGRRALVICGSRTLVAQGVLDEIQIGLWQAGIDAVPLDTIRREPEVEDVDRAAEKVRRIGPAEGDFMLAVGGGAAIDLGKAVAAMAVNRESPTVRDYLEGVGRGLKLVHDPLPVLAMPTTAGTGCEATKNAVISSYDPPFKKSLRDNRMTPQIALVDPELTVSVPPETTAASGMDAITQLFESYISRKARPIPRALAMQGLRLAVPSIAEAVRDGSSRDAREKMAHAALLSGMALANSGLGMAHGVAPALGIHCRVPHGAACAVMLPVALRTNAPARRADLARLARVLLGDAESASPEAAVERLIAHVEGLCQTVGVPQRLSDLGVTGEQIPAIAASSRGSSMSGNPTELSDEQLIEILEAIL
ncbi:MAG: iron-containing alcohol dehydrogenase [Planctomycetota bacterium]